MTIPRTTVTHSPNKGYQRGDTWDARADCRDHDPEKWFPDKRNGYTPAEAKAICRACPVETACLQDALDRREWGPNAGIRAGLDGDELRREARRRAKKARKEAAK